MTFYFGKAQIFKSAITVEITALFEKHDRVSILIRKLTNRAQTSFPWWK